MSAVVENLTCRIDFEPYCSVSTQRTKSYDELQLLKKNKNDPVKTIVFAGSFGSFVVLPRLTD